MDAATRSMDTMGTGVDLEDYFVRTLEGSATLDKIPDSFSL